MDHSGKKRLLENVAKRRWATSICFPGIESSSSFQRLQGASDGQRPCDSAGPTKEEGSSSYILQIDERDILNLREFREKMRI